ncbi:hypothetical protein [Pedobacter sp. SL55]|uniref:hypothetical protein n=1 Tax=Pedobacter sp. SL55 TaxID=2995161 RepID=UPI00226E58C2|nr:hypothetical protein [Pedobacter sp. SL55]WAC42233.1 hypothetical protein OVA16_07725 [Pedobacter sp. SL55]
MNSIRSGTLAGATLSILHLLPWDKLLETVFLAAVGASASFLVSRLWHRFFKPKS